MTLRRPFVFSDLQCHTQPSCCPPFTNCCKALGSCWAAGLVPRGLLGVYKARGVIMMMVMMMMMMILVVVVMVMMTMMMKMVMLGVYEARGVRLGILLGYLQPASSLATNAFGAIILDFSLSLVLS